MSRFTSLQSLGAVATAALTLALTGAPREAHAVLQLSGVNNGVNLFCADQAGCDQDATVGVLRLANVVSGGIFINGSLSTASLPSAVLNSSSFAVVNLNSSAVTISVAVGATNFVGPRTHYSWSGSGTFQNAIGATITDTWWNDPDNAQPATTTSGPLVPGDLPGFELSGGGRSYTATLLSDAFSFSSGGVLPLLVPDGDLFSMALGFTITLPGSPRTCSVADTATCAQLVSRGATLQKFDLPVPEPATVGLVGFGLVGLGLLRRKRR